MQHRFSRRTLLASLPLLTRLQGLAATSGMYVSLNASLLNGKAPWPEMIDIAGQTGYAGCDVNLTAAMKEGADATRAAFARNKLTPGFCSLPVQATRDDEAYRSTIGLLENAAAFCDAIDCRRMMVVMPASAAMPKPEFRRVLRDRLAAAGEVLAKHRVRLGMEFLGPLHFRTAAQYPFMWRMDEMLELAKECGPNVGVVLDCWHWHHSGSTVRDIEAAGKDRIILVHLSDAAKLAPEAVKDNERLLPGEGVIDLPGFFAALKKIGYDGSVSPEPLGRIPKDATAAEGAKLGLDATLKVMRKAGVA